MSDIQKASILRRISAWILDIILLSILAVGFVWVIADVIGYDAKSAQYEEILNKYETEYGLDQYTQEELSELTEEEMAAYEAAILKANEAIAADKEFVDLYNLIIQMTILMTSIGIFLAVLILEFGIPMWLGNGQTVGKKIFGLAVIRSHGVRINGVCLFIRSVLGKYTIEIMIPVLILIMMYMGLVGVLSVVLLAGLLLTQLVLVIVTSNNCLIHDKMSDTVVVDMASQMIFESEEARLDFQKHEAAEKAERQPY